jgi:hypothetical protein
VSLLGGGGGNGFVVEVSCDLVCLSVGIGTGCVLVVAELFGNEWADESSRTRCDESEHNRGGSKARGRRMQGPVEEGQGMKHQQRIQRVSRGSTRVSRHAKGEGWLSGRRVRFSTSKYRATTATNAK